MVAEFISWQTKVSRLTALTAGVLAVCAAPVMAADVPAASGKTPAAKPAVQTVQTVMKEAGPSCAGGLPEPMVVRMNVGKSTLVNLPEQVVRRTLGDPEVAAGHMVAPRVLYLAGGRIGTTNAILEGASGRCVLMDIRVELDTSALQAKLAEFLPNEKGIKVSSAADSIVLTGVVADAMTVERAVTIANAFARASYTQIGGGVTGSAPVQGVSPRIVNLLAVSSPQQVMLEVKVAEVSKTLLNKLGVGVGITGRNRGSWSFDLMTPHLSGTNVAATATSLSLTDLITLEAQKDEGLARILAEPTVMAISGQEGSFLAGGKILIPVAQSGTAGSAAIGLEEREFGVGLRFTPVVLADGRINLKVAPEVSELSAQGAKVTTTTADGTTVGNSSVFPLISTRRASTTVQLLDGQSFVIGGLVKNSSAASINAFPGLGDIPILGALFRSNNFQQEKTEMVFVVTPRLVKPLMPDFQLPTDRVQVPVFSDMVTQNRLEGPAPAANNAPQTSAPQPQADGMQLK